MSQITVAETHRRRGPRRLLRRRRARCATWCRTTCCSCSAWSRWSRRRALDADAVRDEKLKVLQRAAPDRRGDAVATDRARPVPRRRDRRRAGARLSRGGRRRSAATPRPSSRSRPRSRTGAGRACRSTCAPASACRTRLSEIVVAVPRGSAFDLPAGRRARSRRTGWSSACSRTRASSCCLMAKEPGPGGMRLRAGAARPELRRGLPASAIPDAYERLLMDVDPRQPDPVHAPRRGRGGLGLGRADPRGLAARRDEPPKPYAAGTWGPAAAIALIERDGRTWHEDDGLMHRAAVMAPSEQRAIGPCIPAHRRGHRRASPSAAQPTRAAYLDRIARRGRARPAPRRARPAPTSRTASPPATRTTRTRCAAATSRPTSPSSPPTTTCSRRISRSSAFRR